MSIGHPKPGLNNVPEYQASGLPFVTSSTVATTPLRVDFTKVTRAITVRNLGSGPILYVGFTSNGVTGSNRFAIPSGSSERFEVRCKNVFLMSEIGNASFSLLGELTLIDTSQMPTLTGSVSGSVDGGSSWTGVG